MARPAASLVFPALLLVTLLAALARREHADSPAPPPVLPAPERQVLAETAPIDPAVLVRMRSGHGPAAGTAFSIGDGGLWLTSAQTLGNCARLAVLVNEVDAVAASVVGRPNAQVAVLTTAGGAPALPLAAAQPIPGALGYAPGFAHGRPAEAAVHLIGRDRLTLRGRGAARTPVLVWAEMGRTEGLAGALTGLAGAPLLDPEGRVVGVVLAAAPRRGRLYAETPATITAALAAAKAPRPTQASGAAISLDDYGLAADALRRALRVAPLACRGR